MSTDGNLKVIMIKYRLRNRRWLRIPQTKDAGKEGLTLNKCRVVDLCTKFAWRHYVTYVKRTETQALSWIEKSQLPQVSNVFWLFNNQKVNSLQLWLSMRLSIKWAELESLYTKLISYKLTAIEMEKKKSRR